MVLKDEWGDDIPYTIELTLEQIAKEEKERKELLEMNKRGIEIAKRQLGTRNVMIQANNVGELLAKLR